jgi:hypothetical protein
MTYVKHSGLVYLGFVAAGSAFLIGAGPRAADRFAEPQPPDASAQTGAAPLIDGPAKAMLGDLVILDATASGGEQFAWVLVCPDQTKRCLPVDAGRRCVFASGSTGRFVFVLAMKKADQLLTATHVVEIENPSPPPGPNPGPDPNPAPVPDGKLGLAKLALDWATTQVALPPALLRQTAQSLAGSFESIASAIAAGTLRDPAEILAQTRQQNNQVLGEQQAPWRPWGAKLAEKLDELHRAGRLPSPADYADAWREIATGLRAVGKTSRQWTDGN